MKRIRQHDRNRLLSLFLALAMLMTLLPAGLYVAAETTPETAKAALAEALQGLSRTVSEPVAMPPEAVRKTVTAETVIDGLADTSVLGGYYADRAAVAANNGLSLCVSDFSKYESFSFWYCGQNEDGSAVSFRAALKYNHFNTWFSQNLWNVTMRTGWTSYTLTKEDMAAAAETILAQNSLGFQCQRADNTAGYVSYGCVLGHYTVRPTLPENYASLSLRELTAVALQVETTGYDAAAVAALRTAIQTARMLLAPATEEEAIAALKAAWQGLSTETAEVWGVPRQEDTASDAVSVTAYQTLTEADTAFWGVTAAQLGGYAATFTYAAGKKYHYDLLHKDLTQYDRVEVWLKADRAAGKVLISPFSTLYETQGVYLPLKTTWQKVTLSADTSQYVGSFFRGISAYTLLYGELFCNDNVSETVNVTAGALVGYREMTVPLPEGAETFTLNEWIDAAKRLDTAACPEMAVAQLALALREAEELSPEGQAFYALADGVRAVLPSVLPARVWTLSLARLTQTVAAAAAENPLLSEDETVAAALSAATAWTEARQALLTAWQGLTQEKRKTLATFEGGVPVTEKLADSLGVDATLLGEAFHRVDSYAAQKWLPRQGDTVEADLSRYKKLLLSARRVGDSGSQNPVLALQFLGGNTGTWYAGYGTLTAQWGTYVFDASNPLGRFLQGAEEPDTVSGVQIGFWNPGSQDVAVEISSLIGVYDVTPALPENSEILTLAQLRDAAEQLDLTGYAAAQRETFETALRAVWQLYGHGEFQQLLTAWQAMSREVCETVAAAEEHDITQLSASLSLTQAQKERMGPSYVTSERLTYSAAYKYKSLQKFDRLTLSYYYPGETVTQIFVTLPDSNTHLVSWLTLTEPGFHTITLDETGVAGPLLRGETTFNGIKFGLTVPESAYVGSLLGWYRASALPENAAAMTHVQLIAAAMRVDTSRYDVGVESFEQARQAAYAMLSEPVQKRLLLDQWETIAYEEPVVLAACGNNEIAEIPVTLSAGQQTLMGPRYTVGRSESYADEKIPYKNRDLSEFNRLSVSYYLTEGQNRISVQIMNGQGCLLNWVTVSEPGFHTVSRGVENAVAAALLSGDQTINGVITTAHDNAETVYIGALIGWRTVKPVLPENSGALSLDALVSYMDAYDFGFGCETEAVQTLKEYLVTARELTHPYAVAVEANGSGTLTLSASAALPGDCVTVTAVPSAGHQLAAGSLRVYNAAGEAVDIPMRLGMRTNNVQSDTFVFTMPDEPVTVKGTFVDTATLTAPNFGLVGYSVNRQKQGLRAVFRLYREKDAEDRPWTTVGGTAREIVDFGVILTTETTAGRLGLTALTREAAEHDEVLLINFSDQYHRMRFDVCEAYEDYSVCVTQLNSQLRQSTDLMAVSYVHLEDDTVYYTPLTQNCYENYVTERVYHGDNGELQQVTLLTESPTVNSRTEFEMKLPSLGADTNWLDPSEVDVSMVMTGPNGETITMPGFVYQDYRYRENGQLLGKADSDPTFRVRVTPTTAGRWEYTLALKVSGQEVDRVTGWLTVQSNSASHGFVRVNTGNRRTFVFDDGTPYVAIGENLAWGWPNTNTSTMSAYLSGEMSKIAAAGGNFARIWNAPYALYLFRSPTEIAQSIASQFDRLFEVAEEKEMYLDLTLFNHGQFSSTGSDASFAGSAFNAANGGYLTNAADFFTNAQARQDTQNFLRYAVARWGYSTSLFTWELFNELDGTDGWGADQTNNTEHVKAWHAEMAQYLKALDPYAHLVSTSVANNLSKQWDTLGSDPMDFVNLHRYNYEDYGGLSMMTRELTSLQSRYQKPSLAGECGVASSYSKFNGHSIGADLLETHQQTWAGMMGGGAGTGMTWYWEELEALNGYSVFTPVSRMAAQMDWANKDFHALTSLTISNSQLKGVGYSTGTEAYLYLYDNTWRHENRTVTAVSGATVSLSLGNGTYDVIWVDTWTGEACRVQQTRVQSGTLSLNVPALTGDLALVVKPHR